MINTQLAGFSNSKQNLGGGMKMTMTNQQFKRPCQVFGNVKEVQHQLALINGNFSAKWPYTRPQVLKVGDYGKSALLSKERTPPKVKVCRIQAPSDISPVTLNFAMNLVREDKDSTSLETSIAQLLDPNQSKMLGKHLSKLQSSQQSQLAEPPARSGHDRDSAR